MTPPHDALLLVSFGGPQGPEDVVPFLRNVLAGRDVSDERLAELAEPYEWFGGDSPINAATRALLRAIVAEFNAHGLTLPVYWGNRHWHPLLADTLRDMAEDGVHRALALVTSAFDSPPGRQHYLDAIERARREVGPNAPAIDPLPLFHDRPGFLEAVADRTAAALGSLDPSVQSGAKIVFTAHSLPASMAAEAPYVQQLGEACRLVGERLGRTDWLLAYQSRGALAAEAWLSPELGDTLVELGRAGGCSAVVLSPIGFVMEHKETAFDLDVEMAALAERLALPLARAVAVGTHPKFVALIRQLVEERLA